MSADPSLTVHLRIICLNPPIVDGAEFGLQDKTPALHRGERTADGALIFTCDLQAKPGAAGAVHFTGSFAHGTPAERFLYLSLGKLESGSWNWTKRLKIPLKSISWTQVEADGILEAVMDGRGAATVPLSGAGWTIKSL